MALQTYWTKRRFGITPEPRGKTGKRGGNAFVIQKHAATRLHYDLRLELDGVMKSWAVTRGPSLVPGEKRLAVQVEDHPIEYNKFEGTIPKGEYGGGTVMIWDRGTWAPDEDPHKGLKKGRLDFHLDGTKLHGGWHLVRMRKRPGEKRDNWLLIKSDDEFARGPRDPDILEEENLSAATGRRMDEIAGAEDAVWHSNRPVKENAARLKRAKPAKKVAKAKTTKAKVTKTKSARPKAKRARKSATKAKASKRKAKKAKADPVPGARPARLPDFIPPCLALLGTTAPDSDDWMHEIKFDGYRMQARIDSRQGPAAHAQGARLDRQIRTDRGGAEAASGRAGDHRRRTCLRGRRRSRQLFEIAAGPEGRQQRELHLLRLRPALSRRSGPHARAARSAQAGVGRSAGGFRNPPGAPERAFHRTRFGAAQARLQIGLEGIISKRRDAPYRPGRGGDWIKAKCSDRQEFIIAGYAPSTVDPRAIGALIVAFNRDGQLHYAGRVGTGYTHKVARELWKKLQPLRIEKPPFATKPVEETRARNAQWVEPKTGRRSRPPGLDAWRTRAPSFVPGIARRQIRQGSGAGGQSHGDSQRPRKPKARTVRAAKSTAKKARDRTASR